MFAMPHILSNRSKNRLEFSIHPAALPAFTFYHSRKFWADKTTISRSSLADINRGLMLNAVKSSKNKIAIISGFESFSFSLATLSLADCNVIMLDEISDKDIERRAWISVLRSLLSSIDNSSAEDFRRALNQCTPKPILNMIFDTNKLSQRQLAGIIHSSRSTLAQQNAKASAQLTTPSKELSIFEQLLRERKQDV